MRRTGRPRGSSVSDELKIARERMDHEIEVAELERSMQRERLIADLLRNPRVFYTLMIGGSAALAFVQALIERAGMNENTADKDRMAELESVIKRGLVDVFSFNVGGVGGVAVAEGLNWITGWENGSNWLDSLTRNAGKGGVFFFGSCLILHEIFGGENSGMGEKQGGLGALLPVLGAAL